MSAIGTDISGPSRVGGVGVSVVIPMRDAGATIVRALDSLLDQPGCDWEAVVVDDASTDDSAAIVAARSSHDGRVRLVRREWQGLAGARNSGIEASRGRWLVFLDADDWMHPGALGRLVECAARSTGAAHGGAAWHDAEGRSLGWSFAPSCPSVGLNELLESARFVPAAQVIARELLGSERFRADHAGLEDLDLWLRLASRGVRWTALHEDVCAYRLRARSMSRDFGRMAASHRDVLSDAFSLALSRGWERLGVDCSPARRERVTQRAALEYATAEAMGDPWPDLRRAMRILLGCGTGAMVDAGSAALAAWWMLPYAACLPPDAWSREGPHLGELTGAAERWWGALGREGMAAPGLVDQAFEALAELAVGSAEIASDLAARCEAGRPVVVLGLGRNATPLVRALRARGLSVAARDDGAAAPTARVDGVEVRVLARGEPFDCHARHIMSVADDERYLRTLPAGLVVHRWSQARATLAGAARQRIEAARPSNARHEAAA